ncbi:Glycosyl hydrolase family 10 [Candidatus Sulfopaludibacter sp. SbA6]|nr:Glycosyl hydrolase family 10 [Candidatus Sulfopaludibacter sp. SbA6]
MANASLLVLLAPATLFAWQSTSPLRELAESRGIRVGTAVTPAALKNDPAYAATLAREFNQVEPENAAKFGPVHPQEDTYNFEPADALVAFTKAHDMAVRGHTLVWHNQNPAWLTRGGFGPDRLAAILQKHIQTVMGRFAGQIYAWDVVNEAFEKDGMLRRTIWFDSPGIGRDGTAYIEQAFRWAHAADPKALLFYNDYDAEGINAKSDAIYQMAKDFVARGVPIDGIGLQMHLTLKPPTIADIEANIKRLTGLGLQVQYTELDVRLPLVGGSASEHSLAAQARTYHDVAAVCLEFKLCTAIQTWGFTDKFSWIPGAYRGMGAALEFDAGYQPKEAYRSIASALAK